MWCFLLFLEYNFHEVLPTWLISPAMPCSGAAGSSLNHLSLAWGSLCFSQRMSYNLSQYQHLDIDIQYMYTPLVYKIWHIRNIKIESLQVKDCFLPVYSVNYSVLQPLITWLKDQVSWLHNINWTCQEDFCFSVCLLACLFCIAKMLVPHSVYKIGNTINLSHLESATSKVPSNFCWTLKKGLESSKSVFKAQCSDTFLCLILCP